MILLSMITLSPKNARGVLAMSANTDSKYGSP